MRRSPPSHGRAGRPSTLCVDVADDALSERLGPVVARRGGVVSGILHGAGAIADRRLEEKRALDFDRVCAPKLRGLRALLDAVDNDDLRFIVLFSSAAGFYGNAGQADYAVANEVLNKAAYRLRDRLPACRVIAFDWGPWGGGEGMVTPTLEKLFEAKGIELVPPEFGAAIVADALEPGSDPTVQLLVGSPFVPPARLPGSPQAHRIVRHLRQESNPFLDDHVIGGRRVLPVTCAMAWIADSCEGRYPGLRVVQLNDCRVLGGVVVDERETVDLTLELEETGRTERSEVTLHASVTGSAPSHRHRPLYSAEIVLAPEHPPSPQIHGKRPRRGPRSCRAGRCTRMGRCSTAPASKASAASFGSTTTVSSSSAGLPRCPASFRGSSPLGASIPMSPTRSSRHCSSGCGSHAAVRACP